MKNNRGKCCIFGIIFFILSIINISTAKAVDVIGGNGNIKSVVVLDGSLSMKYTDPQNIRIDAFRLFIDMCTQKGDKVGLIAYGSGITKDTGIRNLYSYDDKNKLKNEASGIALSNKTDIGLGLRRAVDELSGSQSGKEAPLIIILSDGKNDPQREMEKSKNDIQKSIDIAKQNGFPVYTIGLNSDGSVDENLLTNIANQTSGKYFVTNSAKNLPEIFGQIFADRTQLKIMDGKSVKLSNSYIDFPLNMPDNNAVEANIIIMSDIGVKNTRLFGNDGKEIKLPSNNIIATSSDKYILLKIIKPKQQRYVVKLKGGNGKTAVVSALFNYDLQLSVNYTPQDSIKKDDVVKVKAELQSNGSPIKNDFYKEFKGRLYIKETQTGKASEIELLNTGAAFESEFKVTEEGNYEFRVRLDGKSLFRESSIFGFTTVTQETPAPYNEKINKSQKQVPRFNYLLLAEAALGATLLIILLLVFKKLKTLRKKSNVSMGVSDGIKETAISGAFSGQLMISIKNRGIGDEEFQPFFRRLDSSKKQVTLHELLSELPGFKETEKLIFYIGTEKGLALLNNSKCIIEKNTVKIKSRKIKLENEERIIISLAQTKKEINIQYFSGE